jgi:prolyl-tRNA synthetase
MRMSTLFAPTRKEDPADAEIASHRLLVRAGFIRMVARGIYSFLPLGWRSVRKIERIVREEMDRAGAQEMLMPGVQPAELWQESGRWDAYGAELLRLKDRKGSDFALGPTHEEVVTSLVRDNLTSYKQLPVNLYQIQTKFRDEPRPRFGLMRGREFVMKDAYSFDVDAAGAHASYEVMKQAYHRIFERMGFDFVAVEADTGNIGGSLSHEFQVVAETGEDVVVRCTTSGRAWNVEKAPIAIEDAERDPAATFAEREVVKTPKTRTIAEVSEFLARDASQIVKTLIYLADGEPLAVLMRGDHAANEVKILAHLRASGRAIAELVLADDATVSKLTRAPVGFAGPVGLEIPIYADLSVRPMVDFVTGANMKDRHLTGVNWGRDFEVAAFADFRRAQGGDVCAATGSPYEEFRGIEVGHIFYLGTKYSDAMTAKLQGEDGELKSLEMGCYGIGITRILAAAVEQSHDGNGIVWPMPLAPFHVTVLPLQARNEEVMAEAERIYAALLDAGVEVVLDDRDARAGAKFKDADLIGFPVQIAIGSRGLAEGNVEVKRRGASDKELVPTADVVDVVAGIVAEGLNR